MASSPLQPGRRTSVDRRLEADRPLVGARRVDRAGHRAGVLPAPGGKQIPYSEFKALVRGGQVAEVAVGDTHHPRHVRRRPTTNGAGHFTTTRIEDPKLVEDLDQPSVKYCGEIVSRWLPEILGWVVPLRPADRRRGRSSSAGSAAPRAA